MAIFPDATARLNTVPGASGVPAGPRNQPGERRWNPADRAGPPGYGDASRYSETPGPASPEVRVFRYDPWRHDRYRRRFCILFNELVPPGQRIPPEAILELAGRNPVRYRLFLAVRDHAVVGYLSLVLNPERKIALIGYLGAVLVPGLCSGEVSRPLIAALAGPESGMAADWTVAFEICPVGAGSARSRAKARLFGEYARVTGCRMLRLPLPYRQPDPGLGGNGAEIPADLYAVSRPGAAHAFGGDDGADLVETIYHEVYLRTRIDLGDSDAECAAYSEYLTSLRSTVRMLGLREGEGCRRA